MRNSGSYLPLLSLIMILFMESESRPERIKPRIEPIKAPVYRYPVWTSLNHNGGPKKMAASTTPMKTVQPMITPWIKQAYGCQGLISGYYLSECLPKELQGERKAEMV
ncbi:unnamed protein product [Aspergillus oryzae]|uniref:Unnamed protein product n=2 Tax=Aspergillus oryzae TaxID=5062 RepID=A0AAN5C4J2_ASPOZ|nr:unnamed protein product [Aspergillus oryzae]GMF93889.1 unnamed protein product [Aspergillus oryzae]GMG12147.1 unnamed protein product [Aspergillus oryzae]GMG37680.1 unnamed protein product [Aspergillus oryzae]GMG50071.1 unnamed protein product [Aspergillus oryzae var. brunneus]